MKMYAIIALLFIGLATGIQAADAEDCVCINCRLTANPLSWVLDQRPVFEKRDENDYSDFLELSEEQENIAHALVLQVTREAELLMLAQCVQEQSEQNSSSVLGKHEQDDASVSYGKLQKYDENSVPDFCQQSITNAPNASVSKQDQIALAIVNNALNRAIPQELKLLCEAGIQGDLSSLKRKLENPSFGAAKSSRENMAELRFEPSSNQEVVGVKRKRSFSSEA